MSIKRLKKLTPRQERFVAEYVVHRNGARAARASGYSSTSAKVTASRLLTVDNVLRAIKVQESKHAAAFSLSTHKVFENLMDAIFLAKRKDDPRALIAGWSSVATLCGFMNAPRR